MACHTIWEYEKIDWEYEKIDFEIKHENFKSFASITEILPLLQ